MKGFIELTLRSDKKILVNVNYINCVWTYSNDTMFSTNSDLEGTHVDESYEEVLDLIKKAIE